MTRRSPLAALAAKDLRAASPALLVALAAIIASAVLADGQYRGLGVLAYVTGAAAVGALMVGHEYVHRTLPSLLTLPRSRRWLLTVKLAVLVALLAPLAAAGHLLTFPEGSRGNPETRVLFWLPLVTAVGVAPWLTMVCRSVNAGVAFSLAMPGFMFCAALVTWMVTHGLIPVSDVFAWRFAWYGTLAMSAIGAVSGWRAFHGLQVFEGRGVEWGLPRLRSRPSASGGVPARRSPPVRLLLLKELRLQRMTTAVALGYLGAWALMRQAREWLPDDVPSVMTLFYVAFLPMMPGSLASAEERQFGTVEWQLLLPVAVWKQWLVKVAVVLAVALGLAIGLPLALATIPDGISIVRLGAAVLLIAAGSLYVSSACSGSLWALLASMGAMVTVVPLTSKAIGVFVVNPFQMLNPALRLAAGLGLAIVVLSFAMYNHRFIRGTAPFVRIGWAVGGFVVCAMLALTLTF